MSQSRPTTPRPRLWRLSATYGTVLGGLAFVAAVFWFQDLRYALPTPRPVDLRAPDLGARVSAEELAQLGLPSRRPLFLHFASDDCPCSRFVVAHLRELARNQPRVHFLVVNEGPGGDPLELGLPELDDRDGRLAARLGVYATPQAVLLDAQGRIYYRGNYQSARYCTDPASEYARLALEDLAAGRGARDWPAAALVSYGCALPGERGK